jgi:hypothetical protein
MQPTPIVLPGDWAERIAGAKFEAAARVVAAWPVVRKNWRRFRVGWLFIDPDLSVFG